MLGRFGIFVYLCRQIIKLKTNKRYEEILLIILVNAPATGGKC